MAKDLLIKSETNHKLLRELRLQQIALYASSLSSSATKLPCDSLLLAYSKMIRSLFQNTDLMAVIATMSISVIPSVVRGLFQCINNRDKELVELVTCMCELRKEALSICDDVNSKEGDLNLNAAEVNSKSCNTAMEILLSEVCLRQDVSIYFNDMWKDIIYLIRHGSSIDGTQTHSPLFYLDLLTLPYICWIESEVVLSLFNKFFHEKGERMPRTLLHVLDVLLGTCGYEYVLQVCI